MSWGLAFSIRGIGSCTLPQRNPTSSVSARDFASQSRIKPFPKCSTARTGSCSSSIRQTATGGAGGRKRSSAFTSAATAGGVPQPPLDLTEDNVGRVLAEPRAELGQLFDGSVGITARFRDITRLNSALRTVKAQASNISIGSGGNEGGEEQDNQKKLANGPSDSSSDITKAPTKIPYPLSIALVLLGCAVVYSLIVFVKGKPSSFLAVISKSGLTAAFSLIFVSEIGDKTFFIAALLAMQYEKGLVLLGSMGALSLMTILSVVIGRVFRSVPAQFQTTLPIGEYAAIALLLFFGLKSIKDAWDLPSAEAKNGAKSSPELDEYASAEELVKEKLSKPLTNPFEIVWKSFSLVFFAEWGDRSMLATIALGAAQSPWGVATGAIAGHLIATSIAIVGGAFLAKYISEKLVGYVGGALFLVFAVATFFGVF